MSINKLLKKYDIKVNKNHEILLNDFFKKTLNSKNLSGMLARSAKSSAKYHIRIDDGEYFIYIWNLCRLIQNNNNTL
jgi:hypothetical protein